MSSKPSEKAVSIQKVKRMIGKLHHHSTKLLTKIQLSLEGAQPRLLKVYLDNPMKELFWLVYLESLSVFSKRDNVAESGSFHLGE